MMIIDDYGFSDEGVFVHDLIYSHSIIYLNLVTMKVTVGHRFPAFVKNPEKNLENVRCQYIDDSKTSTLW